MLVIFVAGISALAVYASSVLRAEMRTMLGEQQFSTVSVVAQELNEDLRDRVRALEAIAMQLTPAVMENGVALQNLLDQRPLLPLFVQRWNMGIPRRRHRHCRCAPRCRAHRYQLWNG